MRLPDGSATDVAASDRDTLHLPDGSRCHLHHWRPPAGTPTRAVVQVVHGMAEHGGRYARLAGALTVRGYAVCALDLPGHGRSAADHEALGRFASAEAFDQLVAAAGSLRRHLAEEHAGLPLVLLGHSLGSFVAQALLVAEGGAGWAGCVLSGTTGDLGPLRRLGVVLNRAQVALWGPEHRSALTEALTFKAFNRRFAPNRTDFDWLSRDAAEVDAYVADPLCGFRCSAGLWLSLLRAGASFTDPTRLQRIADKALPLLLIAGGDDPVCEGAKGPEGLAAAYRRAGLMPEVRIYSQARHELFNETNREAVTTDLLTWLDARVAIR